MARIPRFLFATIPDGLPKSDADATMTTCLPYFRKLLADLNNRAAGDDDDDAVPPVTCVVADHLLGFSLDATVAVLASRCRPLPTLACRLPPPRPRLASRLRPPPARRRRSRYRPCAPREREE
ncbi:Os02g0679000 [Oryza sativa Japonica Group]|nr:Os02g0679000 [Oryza sativa Japonica Group]